MISSSTNAERAARGGGASLRVARLLGLSLIFWGVLCAHRPARADDASRFSVVDVGDNLRVIARTRDGAPGTEGLVVDSKRLVETLKARVLEARGLGEVGELEQSFSFSGRRSPAPKPAPYVFTHRFAPPFASLEASLQLRPLAEPDEGAFLYPLIGLLAAAVVLGLYALYRMAATQVAFAQRQSDFVSAVSHELKTPLTAIRMYAEMLKEDLVGDDARRKDYYRTITLESERLTRLINNVLQLSRIERQTAPLALRVGAIRPVVEEALEFLRPHAEREGFTLELELDPELGSARFEPDALKQVLFNLVDNAIKYSRDSDDRRISVRCSASADGGTLLAVRDRGPGVQREQLKAIFEPFFRGERELTRKNPGTGIGLALVKKLVEAMGGRVRGENTAPGFQVRIELARG